MSEPESSSSSSSSSSWMGFKVSTLRKKVHGQKILNHKLNFYVVTYKHVYFGACLDILRALKAGIKLFPTKTKEKNCFIPRAQSGNYVIRSKRS